MRCNDIARLQTEVRLNVGGEIDPMWLRPDEGDGVLEIVVPSRPLVAGAR